jgi:hypothetical protein
MSGQLHAPAALSPGKEPPKILNWSVENSAEQFPRNWFNFSYFSFFFLQFTCKRIIFGKVIPVVKLIQHYTMKAYGGVDV